MRKKSGNIKRKVSKKYLSIINYRPQENSETHTTVDIGQARVENNEGSAVEFINNTSIVSAHQIAVNENIICDNKEDERIEGFISDILNDDNGDGFSKSKVILSLLVNISKI